MASDDLAGRVRQLAGGMDDRLREIRRRIHRHPELGFEERETARLAADRLGELGLEVREKVCRTGVVGLLRGPAPGPAVALRADMDALPLEEQGDHTYRSKRYGVKQSSGHDAHVACLLGAAEILAELREEFSGTVTFLFQPGEEDLPSGALAMTEAGVLQDPEVRALVALHVDPQLPAGHVGIRAGPFLAEARDFDIRILGRSGHGAHPHEGVDALVAAARFIIAAQTLVSRRVDPLEPAVVSIGQIEGGQADNIIAGQVDLRGTLRCLDPVLADRLVGELETLLAGVAGSAGARWEIDWSQGCLALQNDAATVDAVRRAVRRLYGPEVLHDDIPRSMGGDDFSYFLQQVPGALFVLGAGDGTERTSHPLHHPRFDIDESALIAGAAVLALSAVELLS
jgi:amidohydrolase